VVNVAVNAALAANYATAAAETVRALAAEGLLAPLASPPFTGAPSLPTGTIAVTQAPGNATAAPATTAFVGAAVAASGVTTFNTRLGAVTLGSADVTTALAFTPYNATNPSGYQTAAQVTTTLTPYATTASVPALAPVQSVATRTGAVSLTHSDLTDWAAATASFGGSLFIRSARTSNTILGTADKGTLVDITSGTFAQTFTASATLASGWFCYLRNSGTGAITLTPNGAETIDGLTTFVMYPQECRLVQCSGTTLTSVVLHPFYQIYTASLASGFVKPPGYVTFAGLLWGGASGGGKAATSNFAHGGAGGVCVPLMLLASAMAATNDVTIGAGGTGASVNGDGTAGGDSSVATYVTAKGAPAGATTSYDPVGVQQTATAGVTIIYNGGIPGGNGAQPAATLYGGTAGGGVSSGNVVSAPATAFYGGAGGAAVVAAPGSAGSTPGGGGGATQTGANAGNGARGELRIWGVV
jgi:hypothetical protein